MTTIRIVVAYVSSNSLKQDKLQDLIKAVHEALIAIIDSSASKSSESEQPALVEVGATIRQDSLISLIDGRLYKTLKRHLSAHGLNPELYRAKYRLPADYPMVSPDYAAKRSEIAKAIQLGRKWPTPRSAPS